MINKHSTNRSEKSIPASVRIARVISTGNGTVDVSPIGSSVVLHDIPVSGSPSLQNGDTVYVQMIDNKRMAFPEYTEQSRGETVIYSSSVVNAGSGGGGGTMEAHAMSGGFHFGEITTSQATWAALKSTVITAGAGLSGGGTLASSFTISVGAGNGIAVADSGVSVKRKTTSGLDLDANGLAVGAGNGIEVFAESVAVKRATTSGLSLDANGLAVGAGNGISVLTNSVAVNQDYAFVWTGVHRFTNGLNVGTYTTASGGNAFISGNLGVGKDSADYRLDVAGDIYSSASVRANTSVVTQELTGAGATTSVSLTNGTTFKSSQYVSGFAGNGWRIFRAANNSLSEMEVDNLTVRGALRVYELLIQQIRATNGSIFVSSSAKIATVTGPSAGVYTITVDGSTNDYVPFAVNDVLRAQRINLNNPSSLVWQSDIRVASVTANAKTFTAVLVAGEAPAPGMEYVRLGNTTNVNRQGTVYLTADDTGAPFIDVVDGIASHSDWNTASKVKVRIGNLVGITGTANNYGIWAGNGTAVNNQWVEFSETRMLLNNVPIKIYNGTTQTVDIDSNGNLKIGSNVANASTTFLSWNGTTLSVKGVIEVAAGSNVYTTAQVDSSLNGKIDSGGAASDVNNNTTTISGGKIRTGQIDSQNWGTSAGSRIDLSNGAFYFGGSSAPKLSWNGTTLAIDGNLTARNGSIEGILTIGSGGQIRQGTGSLTANPATFTGLRVWSDSSFGRIAGYNNGTVQWEARNDGKLYAGGGNVIMSSRGIGVWPATVSDPVGSDINAANSIDWFDPGDAYGYGWAKIAGYKSNTATYRGGFAIYVREGEETSSPAIICDSYKTGYNVLLYGNSNISTGSLKIDHGLNVGSETGAAVGQIKASGILEVQKTQLLRYKYGPSGFDDTLGQQPYLQYTVTNNGGGIPMGAFLIYIAGRDNGSVVVQELWYFQVHRAYQSTYGWTSQRIAGGSDRVIVRQTTNTAGSASAYTGTLTVRWWVGGSSSGFNDGLEVTVMELGAGISAGHYGTFSMGTGAVSGTESSYGVVKTGDMIADRVVIDADAGAGITGAVSLTNATTAVVNDNNRSLYMRGTTGASNETVRNAGLLKMYVGTTAVYVPYWTQT